MLGEPPLLAIIPVTPRQAVMICPDVYVEQSTPKKIPK